MADDEDDMLAALTAEVVAAHVGSNTVALDELPELIRTVYDALSGIGRAPEPELPSIVPSVSIRASVKPDHLVCLECGARQKTLKRHLAAAHGETPAEYREKFGLPVSYPMVAATYSETRKTLAKAIGLGRNMAGKGAAAEEAPVAEGAAAPDDDAELSAKAPRRRLGIAQAKAAAANHLSGD